MRKFFPLNILFIFLQDKRVEHKYFIINRYWRKGKSPPLLSLVQAEKINKVKVALSFMNEHCKYLTNYDHFMQKCKPSSRFTRLLISLPWYDEYCGLIVRCVVLAICCCGAAARPPSDIDIH